MEVNRVKALENLLAKVEPIPADWVPGRSAASVSAGSVRVEPAACDSWQEVVARWRRALHWRRDLGDLLAVMLATCASTSQRDDQLMLQVIGDPGSAKSQLCEGLLVSQHCHALDTITGFVSGMKDQSGDDFSFLARVNHKTLVTTEGDVLLSLPNFQQIMSQLRKMFDGSLRAVYKNRKEDLAHDALRLPWILCGTPALLDGNQARLGDRFLRFWIEPPSEDDREEATRRAFFSMQAAVKQSADGTPDSCVSEQLLEARRITGGYVDWLRSNAAEKLAELDTDEEALYRACAGWAQFTAILRAKPVDQTKEEKHDAVEQPTRLVKQFCRMANCLAVVLNVESAADPEVLRIIKRVAIDTARGHSMAVIRHVRNSKTGAVSLPGLVSLTDRTEAQELAILRFLRRAGALEHRKEKHGLQTRHLWRLSPKMANVWEAVMGSS